VKKKIKKKNIVIIPVSPIFPIEGYSVVARSPQETDAAAAFCSICKDVRVWVSVCAPAERGRANAVEGD
jgi:hypothetical protein